MNRAPTARCGRRGQPALPPGSAVRRSGPGGWDWRPQTATQSGSGRKRRKLSLVSLDEVYQRLTQIVQDVFDDDALVARPGLTADQVEGWDSFAHLRLIFAVEKAFNVRFAASQISRLQNVGELAELINSKVS